MNQKQYVFLTFLTAFFVVIGLFLALVAGASLQQLMPVLLLLLAAYLTAFFHDRKEDSQ